jgi:hypothetical protein
LIFLGFCATISGFKVDEMFKVESTVPRSKVALLQDRFFGGLRLLAAAGIELPYGDYRLPRTKWLVYIGVSERTGIKVLPGQSGVICFIPTGGQAAKLAFSPGLFKSGPLVVARLTFLDVVEGRVRWWTIPVPAEKAGGLANRISLGV